MNFSVMAQRFRDGAATPRQHLEERLALIEATEPSVRAFVTLNIDGARSAADESGRRYKAGKPLSPIDGMSVGIKDLYETFDMPTQMGSPLFAGKGGMRDNPSVRALRAGGAIILGKTVTTEFGFFNPGATRNPRDLERTPGGSSSGSAAAVAAGFVPATVAGQVVGSLIRPSSYCGIFGLKPTLGAVNRGGATLSQSCTGVMADTLHDLWASLYQMGRAGGDAGYPGLYGGADIGGMRRPDRMMFIETKGWRNVRPAVQQQFRDFVAAVQSLGPTCMTRSDDYRIEELERRLEHAFAITDTVCAFEQQWPLEHYRERFPDKISPNLTQMLERWKNVSLAQYRDALEARDALRAAHRATDGVGDFMITLSAPDIAPKGLDSTGDPVFAVTSSVLGAPALSMPLLEIDGMPLGVQIIGPMHSDARIVQYGLWFWHQFKTGRP